jgi:hypothetical protein
MFGTFARTFGTFARTFGTFGGGVGVCVVRIIIRYEEKPFTKFKK